MIKDEKITSNYKKFVETGKKLNFINDDLIKFLGVDLVNAPLSTNTEYTGCYKGGLIDYTLQVAKYMLAINDTLPESKKIDTDKIMKVAFLHQIGKTKLFVEQTSDWHIKKGILYEYNNDLVSMRISERSIYYAVKHGITFEEEEYQAILNYDKAADDVQSRVHNSDLGRLLNVANEMVQIVKG